MNLTKNLRSFSKQKVLMLTYFFFLQIFLFFWIIGIEKDLNLLLYFCYHAPLLIIILLLCNQEKLIPTLIIFSLFAQLLYIFDFMISHIIKDSLLGYYDYYLNPHIVVHILTLLAHFTSIILLHYYSHIKPQPKHLVITFVYTFTIYLIVILFIPLEYNINGISTTYTMLDYLPMYSILYPVYHLIIIAIPTYFLLLMIYMFRSRRNSIM
ncbi:MAG: hypothetical protein LAT82_01880 [Nanoarchaeota archaeon]|nr:hypothetical protein [Nanoarchaeota archaeon]